MDQTGKRPTREELEVIVQNARLALEALDHTTYCASMGIAQGPCNCGIEAMVEALWPESSAA